MEIRLSFNTYQTSNDCYLLPAHYKVKLVAVEGSMIGAAGEVVAGPVDLC